MDWSTAFSAFVGSVFASGIAAVILAALLERSLTRLRHSLEVERQEQTERRALERRRREASPAVAEILSEWRRVCFVGETTPEDVWRLQTTYWKHVLWLDKSLVEMLAPVLVGRYGPATTDDTDQLIIQARTHLLELDTPDLTTDDLVNSTAIRKRVTTHAKTSSSPLGSLPGVLLRLLKEVSHAARLV
jgi:hypothetical protein